MKSKLISNFLKITISLAISTVTFILVIVEFIMSDILNDNYGCFLFPCKTERSTPTTTVLSKTVSSIISTTQQPQSTESVELWKGTTIQLTVLRNINKCCYLQNKYLNILSIHLTLKSFSWIHMHECRDFERT